VTLKVYICESIRIFFDYITYRSIVKARERETRTKWWTRERETRERGSDQGKEDTGDRDRPGKEGGTEERGTLGISREGPRKEGQ
jgi:hypothetical protein